MNIGKIKLPSNIILGPMAGVTDLSFRRICKKFNYGLSVTEMVSAKALHYNDIKTKKLLKMDEDEFLAVQVFGSEADIMAEAAYRLNDHGSLILDINMGCPAPKIVKNGEGSALMKNPKLVEKIVKAVVKESIKPVTVKIRKGWNDEQVNAIEIAKIIEFSGASAITVHGRTREQFYSGKADYDIIKKVKSEITIPVIGNGDIFKIEDAKKMFDETACDGVMVARGAQGNPWLLKQIFNYIEYGKVIAQPDIREIIEIALKHFNYLIEIKGEHIAMLEMRKHGAWYLKGKKGSAKFKEKINKSKSKEEVIKIFEEVIFAYG